MPPRDPAPGSERTSAPGHGSAQGTQGGSGPWDPRTVVLAALALALGVLLGLAALGSVLPGSLDDAYVVLVHARNLLEGHGWVHRPGGPRVDGFTSPLDLGAKVLALAMSGGDGMRAAWTSSGLAYLLALLLLGVTALRVGRPGPALLLTVPALLLSPGLAEGTTYLLGTPLTVGLLVLFLGSLGRRGDLLPAALGLALGLARPEGFLLAAVGLVWRSRAAGADPDGERPSSRALLAFLFGACAYGVARRAILGTWLPNTFHAKRSDSSLAELRDGLEYLLNLLRLPSGAALLVALALLPLLLGGAPGSGARGRSAQRLGRGALVLAWTALVAVVLEGGDSYLAAGGTEGTRLMAPLCVLVSLALAAATGCASRPRRALALGLLAVSLAGRLPGVLPRVPELPRLLSGEAPSDAHHGCEAALSHALGDAARALDPGAPVAHRDLQCLGWFEAELPLVDLSGLTDPDVARLSASGSVRFGKDGLPIALARRACLVHLDFQRVRPEAWSEWGVRALLSEPALWARFAGGAPPAGPVAEELLRGYRAASLPLEACGGWLNVLVRADLAADLRYRGWRVEP